MDDYVMPFGKHKGKAISEVPASYLVWFYKQDWAEKWVEVYKYTTDKLDQLQAKVEAKEASK